MAQPRRHLRVVRRLDHPGRLLELHLEPVDGTPLSPYVPGSHLAARCGERVNAYSLLDDGHRPAVYRIALRTPAVPTPGSGSGWLQEHAVPGCVLETTVPRSAFPPVASARSHLYLAAGIGVTPILSHLHAARRWGRRTHTVLGHGGDGPPLAAEVTATATGPVELVVGRAALVTAVRSALGSQRVGTHVYACGPAGFLDEVRSAADDLALVPGRLQLEVFDLPPLDDGVAFTATLGPGGAAVDVPPGVSLLHALDDAGVVLDRMCERGVCGRCEIGVLAGRPEHRDLVLSPTEHAAGTRMMPCVSRALGPLVLDPATLPTAGPRP